MAYYWISFKHAACISKLFSHNVGYPGFFISIYALHKIEHATHKGKKRAHGRHVLTRELSHVGSHVKESL